MFSYLCIVYNLKDKPLTIYPNQLIKYISNRFNFKKEYKILDLGCGRGDFLKAFKNNLFDIKGSDILDINIEGIDIKKFDFSKDVFPYEDSSFDVIFSKSVIEHINSAENFLKESYRVLKPGGRILILTPEWKSQMYIFFNDYTHIHPYSIKSMNSVLKVNGFKDVNSERFYQHPIYWKYTFLKIFPNTINYLLGPVRRIHRNKLIRFSRESMVLAYGTK